MEKINGVCDNCQNEGEVSCIVTDEGTSTYLCHKCRDKYLIDENKLYQYFIETQNHELLKAVENTYNHRFPSWRKDGWWACGSETDCAAGESVRRLSEICNEMNVGFRYEEAA